MARLSGVLRGIGLMDDPGTWIEEGRLLACAYPRRDTSLASVAALGVSLIVNMHERAHEPSRLSRYGLTEVHLPVKDFTPPPPEVLDAGVAAIVKALRDGRVVAVHCGGGRGRTGTLVACYLVSQGLTVDEAIRRVRALRPGSVETRSQEAAIGAYAQRHTQR